jgi:hypothetical protein
MLLRVSSALCDDGFGRLVLENVVIKRGFFMCSICVQSCCMNHLVRASCSMFRENDMTQGGQLLARKI